MKKLFASVILGLRGAAQWAGGAACCLIRAESLQQVLMKWFDRFGCLHSLPPPLTLRCTDCFIVCVLFHAKLERNSGHRASGRNFPNELWSLSKLAALWGTLIEVRDRTSSGFKRRKKWVLRPYRPDAIAAKLSPLSTDLISMLIYVILFNEALPHLNYRDSLRKRCYFYANRFNHVKNNHFENESKKSRVDGWKKLIFMEMCVWSRPERVWFDWSASHPWKSTLHFNYASGRESI